VPVGGHLCPIQFMINRAGRRAFMPDITFIVPVGGHLCPI